MYEIHHYKWLGPKAEFRLGARTNFDANYGPLGESENGFSFEPRCPYFVSNVVGPFSIYTVGATI